MNRLAGMNSSDLLLRNTATLRPGRTHGPGRRVLALFLCLTLANLPLTPAYALDRGALPTGGQVTAGSAAIQQSGSQMTVQQDSQKAVIDWRQFNIGADAGVAFRQPNSSSVALNRVLGGGPSQIFGKLSANGQVFLVNPAGILFAPGSQVDVGGFVASSMNITNDDFLAGRMIFHRAGSTGSVVNQGSITAADGGHIALLGPTVRNEGVIRTRFGQVTLAAGETITMNAGIDGHLQVAVDPATVSTLVENKELIQADGGQVIMTARAAGELLSAVVSNSGTVRARTIENRSGRIMLLGDMVLGRTIVSGTLDASAPDSGNGGFIETSAAHVKIADSARITTLASKGKTGTWLIDPDGFTIAASGGDISGAALSASLGSSDVSIASAGGNGSDGNVNVNDNVNWSASKLTLTATNDININAVMNASGTAKLALEYGQGAVVAGNTSDYHVHAAVNLPAGDNFSTKLGSDGTVKNYTVITSLGAAGSATATDLQGMNGNLAKNYALGSDIDASATSGWNAGAGFVPVGTDKTTPFTGAFDGLGHTINGLYINRPSTSNVGLFGYASGSILRNVGLTGGTITGNSYVGGLVGYMTTTTISNSYATSAVNGTGDHYVGGLVGDMYGANTTLTNCYADGNVTGVNDVGGLTGGSGGRIRYSHAIGSVTATGTSSAGGLAGSSNGTIDHSWATVTVTASGAENVGGLVGFKFTRPEYPDGVISDSWATGKVTGAYTVGGLVGLNQGCRLTNNYATGDVTGTGDSVGGLVGSNGQGAVSNSYATGAVNGTGDNTGGLVGYNDRGAISDSYATGNVTGANNVGGLVGFNDGDGGTATITNSYASGTVSGNSYTGGLVGYNAADGGTATISNSYWDTQTSGQASSDGGTGKTTAEMMQASTFAGWDLATTGGSSAVWRIYEGHTSPLLRSFLTGLTLADTTVTYNGSTQTGAAVPTQGARGGTVASGRNAGAYTAYSDQQGYDITSGKLTINKAALTITAMTNTKTYDGTPGAAATPTVSGRQGSDTVDNLIEVYADKNVGSNKTLSVNSYTVNDGNSGANYTVATVNDTSGVIIAAANIAAPLPGISRIDDATLLRITRAGEEEKLKTEPKRGKLLLTVPPDFIRL